MGGYMEDKIISIIFESLDDRKFYNYDNDKRLKNIEISEYTNILGDRVIDIATKNKVYTIICTETYSGKEEK